MPIYTIKCNENIPTPVTVKVWDQRGTKVIAQKNIITTHTYYCSMLNQLVMEALLRDEIL